MKQFLVTACLLVTVLFSFGQKKESPLLNAYKNNSIVQLNNFFEQWLSETPAITDTALHQLNDTIQNIYAVFQNFYTPADITKTGGSEWGDDIYKNVKYLVAQGSIEYGFVDTLDKETLIQKRLSRYDSTKLKNMIKRYNGDMEQFRNDYLDWPAAKEYVTVHNFRPRLNFSAPRVVILTTDYENLLTSFLGNVNYKLGTGNIMSPARSKGESNKRQHFLEQMIRIWYGHWEDTGSCSPILLLKK